MPLAGCSCCPGWTVPPGPRHGLSTCPLAEGTHSRGPGEGAGSAGLSLCWSKGDLATGLSSEGVCSPRACSSCMRPSRPGLGAAVATGGTRPGRVLLCRAAEGSKGALARGRGRHGCPLWQPGPGALKGHKGPMRHGVGPASSSEGHTGQESQHGTLAQPDRPAGGAGPPTSQTGSWGAGCEQGTQGTGKRAADRQMARPSQVDFLK